MKGFNSKIPVRVAWDLRYQRWKVEKQFCGMWQNINTLGILYHTKAEAVGYAKKLISRNPEMYDYRD
jgi:hypothetical protein